LKPDGTIELWLDNGKQKILSSLRFKSHTWHTATITHDKENKEVNAYLDDKLAASDKATLRTYH